MKDKLLLSVAVSFALVVFCGPLFAHHGNAAFSDKPTTLKEAKVTSFSWSNPHSLIEVDAKDDKGKMQHWVVETAAPQALVLIGWSKTSLQPGDVIVVDLFGKIDSGTFVGDKLAYYIWKTTGTGMVVGTGV